MDCSRDRSAGSFSGRLRSLLTCRCPYTITSSAGKILTRWIARLTDAISTPSFRLVMILLTPISRKVHLCSITTSASVPSQYKCDDWGWRKTHVASRSSLLGAGGIDITMVAKIGRCKLNFGGVKDWWRKMKICSSEKIPVDK